MLHQQSALAALCPLLSFPFQQSDQRFCPPHIIHSSIMEPVQRSSGAKLGSKDPNWVVYCLLGKQHGWSLESCVSDTVLCSVASQVRLPQHSYKFTIYSTDFLDRPHIIHVAYIQKPRSFSLNFFLAHRFYWLAPNILKYIGQLDVSEHCRFSFMMCDIASAFLEFFQCIETTQAGSKSFLTSIENLFCKVNQLILTVINGFKFLFNAKCSQYSVLLTYMFSIFCFFTRNPTLLASAVTPMYIIRYLHYHQDRRWNEHRIISK